MNKIDELDKQRRLLKYKLMEAKLEELIKIHKEKGIEKIIPAEMTEEEYAEYVDYMFDIDEIGELKDFLTHQNLEEGKDFEYDLSYDFESLESRKDFNENRWRICSNICR